MKMLSNVASLCRRLFHRSAIDKDLDDEARAFIVQLTDERIASGMAVDEARRTALIEFGGLEQVKEQTRQARSGHWLENLARDTKYACRTLLRDRLFTLIATITLMLGIGANAAVFNLINTLLLRNLAVPQADQLIRVGLVLSGEEALMPGPVFDALKKYENGSAEVMAWAPFEIISKKVIAHNLLMARW